MPAKCWRVFSPPPATPSWVNDLAQLEFGQGYLIYVTTAETVTLFINGAIDGVNSSELEQVDSRFTPPATYYLESDEDLQVKAYIDGTLCGTGVNTPQGVRIKVYADDGDQFNGCGVAGRSVSFVTDSGTLGSLTWDNTRIQGLPRPAIGEAASVDRKPPASARETVYLPHVVR